MKKQMEPRRIDIKEYTKERGGRGSGRGWRMIE